MRGPSPFHDRSPIADPAHFFGRMRELAAVLARTAGAAKPQCVSVVGSRRIGKSSLFRQLVDVHGVGLASGENPLVCVYHDLEGSAKLTVERFFGSLLKKLEKQVARLGLSGTPRNASGPFPEEAFFERVEELSEDGVRLVLYLDEFDTVTLNPNFDADLFGRLRYLTSSFQLAYVTSSFAELTDLCHQQEIRQSPFFNVFSTLHLGLLREEEADALLATESERAGGAFTEDEARFLKELGGTHPFHLRLAANALWECDPPGDLAVSRRQFLADAGPHFRYAFAHLPPRASEALGEICAGASTRTADDPDVEHLLRRGLVVRAGDGIAPFSREFGRWVRERPPDEQPTEGKQATPGRQSTPAAGSRSGSTTTPGRGTNEQSTRELPPREQAGSLLDGRYQLLREIGRGGFGMVFEAKDNILGRSVAIKVLRPDRRRDAAATRLRERFLQEARAASRISHANVVALHDIRERGEDWYFVMEHFAGRSLRELLEEHGALPVEDALRLATQAAAGLDAAHALGIVHRDVKPENMLVNDTGHLKLVDFGLALFVDQARITSGGGMLMTPRYSSPEQVMGDKADARSDIFQLGCVLFELLTGHFAFDGDTTSSVLYNIVHRTPPPLPSGLAHVRPDVWALVEHCLARQPSARPESCAAVAKAIGALLEDDLP